MTDNINNPVPIKQHAKHNVSISFSFPVAFHSRIFYTIFKYLRGRFLMVITKRLFRILSYIYRHGSVPYSKLNRKFKYPTLLEDLENLILQQYVAQVGGSRSKYGEPIPILENTLFTLNDLGIAEVESKQWFNLQFVLTQIVLPIIIAIITTLITIFLAA
jgi:hypothetical protein